MNSYEKAHQEYKAAFAEFDAVRRDYRAMKCGDAEFLAARAKLEKAQADFDAAEAKCK